MSQTPPHPLRLIAALVGASLVGAMLSHAAAQSVPPASQEPIEVIDDEPTSAALAWPRLIERNGARVVVHQPQVDRWPDYDILSARAAVEVLLPDGSPPEFGAVRFTAPTSINFEDRSVQVGRRHLAGTRFPDTDPLQYEKVRKVLGKLMPGNQPMTMSLDEIVAYLDVETHSAPAVTVNLDPPPIYYSQEPAILLMFLGEPRFDPIAGTNLFAAVNSNWDIIGDPETGEAYLLYKEGWLKTTSVENGPWLPVAGAPESFQSLPDTPDYQLVKMHLPGKPLEAAPEVLLSREPAEIIVTDGAPYLAPLGDTSLMWVSNTESDLFFDPDDNNFYVLLAGRWFRAGQLEGPWSPATRDLPSEFAEIPADHDRGDVRSSVPGTPEARAAVLLASVPRKAEISRSDAKVEPAYEGPPDFQLITGSNGVFTAVNTDFDVFRINDLYYCCYQGVWFIARAPTGPWEVADVIPDAMYTIPSYSSKHHVTYVRIFKATPDTVTTGQTGGYTGEVITLGLIMAGVGYALLQADNVNFSGRIQLGTSINIAWGRGARYDARRGGYRLGGGAYGPYGGVRADMYDRRQAQVRAQSLSRPYSSWGRAAQPARRFGQQGSRSFGRRVKTMRDDIYAGADGNVYRRGRDGSWNKRGDKGWKPLDTPSRRTGLDRQFDARSFGTMRANDFSASFGGNRAGRGGGRGGGRR